MFFIFGIMILDVSYMRYKSLVEQNEEFISILKKNTDLIMILDYISELELSNFYIIAGSLFQNVWNYMDNKDFNFKINDIDIIYYDSCNLSRDDEDSLEKKIKMYFENHNLNYQFDIHNEARIHLWKKDNENKKINKCDNCEEIIDCMIATVQAVGITKRDGEIKVYAPYGLSDIFSKTIRPIKHKGNTKELYEKKVNSWSMRFDNLNIIDW